MRIFITALIAVLGLAAANSYAADIRPSAKDTPAHLLPSAVEAPRSWTSVWIAALAGYDMSNTDLSLDVFNTHREAHEGSAGLDGLGGEGFTGTLQVGGDYQFGRVVVGGWGEYTFGGVESSAFVSGAGRLDIDQNDSYGVFARAGLTFGDTLIYGAGGYVWTEADAKLSSGDLVARKTFDFDGPAAELGIEHRFSQNVRGRLSARYTWLNEERLADWADFCREYRLDGEPGILGVKAGIVINTTGLFSQN